MDRDDLFPEEQGYASWLRSLVLPVIVLVVVVAIIMAIVLSGVVQGDRTYGGATQGPTTQPTVLIRPMIRRDWCASPARRGR